MLIMSRPHGHLVRVIEGKAQRQPISDSALATSSTVHEQVNKVEIGLSRQYSGLIRSSEHFEEEETGHAS
jgi:hypothetical protein